MRYLNPRNEFPRYAGDIQLEHPGWKIGDVLPDGWHLINEVTAPECGPDEIAEIAGVEKVGEQYFDQWIIRPLTAEELRQRDEMLLMNNEQIANG